MSPTLMTTTDTTVTTTTTNNNNNNSNKSQSPEDTRYQSFSSIHAKSVSSGFRYGSNSRYSA